MTKDIQVIALYCTVCHHYNTTLVEEAQRLSNNFRPEFSITVVKQFYSNETTWRLPDVLCAKQSS